MMSLQVLVIDCTIVVGQIYLANRTIEGLVFPTDRVIFTFMLQIVDNVNDVYNVRCNLKLIDYNINSGIIRRFNCTRMFIYKGIEI